MSKVKEFRFRGCTAAKVIIFLSAICGIVASAAGTVSVYMAYVYEVFREGTTPEMVEDWMIYDLRGMRHDYQDILLAKWLSGVLFQYGNISILLLIGGILVTILSIIFLLCAAGHRNGKEGILPNVFTGIYFDLFSVVMIALVSMPLIFVEEVVYYHFSGIALSTVATIAAATLSFCFGLLWLLNFAVRLKLGKWWRRTLTYQVLRGCFRIVRKLWRLVWKLFCILPLVYMAVIGFCLISIPEFILVSALTAGRNNWGALFFWMLLKCIELAVVVYFALVCKKLQEAGKAISEGRENVIINTRYMFGPFKEHATYLGNIKAGIARAVEEKMKSERLKTELITNVSHDIKTPLTSIINYADFLGNMAIVGDEARDDTYIKVEKAKFVEYTEVLLRQSTRLKKLLEDLVEASKATTGNLEVNPTLCEVGVLLTQAVGEYQQKMAEKGLELKDRQPEEPVKIWADGRHLWRVFDNLLNNICKYAQENSRVYLSLEQEGKTVHIIFRNMSKYALEITPEELEERFVRGDKSRHMEGNGLGLSIAKSLTELQGGTFSIVTDGDLFKVILTFPAAE